MVSSCCSYRRARAGMKVAQAFNCWRLSIGTWMKIPGPSPTNALRRAAPGHDRQDPRGKSGRVLRLDLAYLNAVAATAATTQDAVRNEKRNSRARTNCSATLTIRQGRVISTVLFEVKKPASRISLRLLPSWLRLSCRSGLPPEAEGGCSW